MHDRDFPRPWPERRYTPGRTLALIVALLFVVVAITLMVADPVAKGIDGETHELGPSLQQLQTELRQLSTRAASISVDVGERGVRNDGQLRADARADHPGVILTIDSRQHGTLVYATDRFRSWQDNLRAIVLGLEALRRVERYGISERGQQYAGFKELGTGIAMAGPAMTMERAAEYLILHGEVEDAPPGDVEALLPGDPLQREIVEGYYRRAARRLHPDVGGDASAFDLARRARDLLLEAEQ